MTRFLVHGVEMSAREIIDFAEQQYGCQAGQAIKFTSRAARELQKHGIEVREVTRKNEFTNAVKQENP